MFKSTYRRVTIPTPKLIVSAIEKRQCEEPKDTSHSQLQKPMTTDWPKRHSAQGPGSEIEALPVPPERRCLFSAPPTHTPFTATLASLCAFSLNPRRSIPGEPLRRLAGGTTSDPGSTRRTAPEPYPAPRRSKDEFPSLGESALLWRPTSSRWAIPPALCWTISSRGRIVRCLFGAVCAEMTMVLTLVAVDRDEVDRLRKRFMKLDKA
jgi:hypothetical protein